MIVTVNLMISTIPRGIIDMAVMTVEAIERGTCYKPTYEPHPSSDISICSPRDENDGRSHHSSRRHQHRDYDDRYDYDDHYDYDDRHGDHR